MYSVLRYFILLVVAFVGIVLFPEQSMALQTHSEPEGVYLHQMAHVLFMAALCYLYWDTKRSAFSGRGWTYLRVFCVLTILWNALAFAGHGATHYLHPVDFTTVDGYLFSKVNRPITFVKFLYYIAKLDHLIMVPAMFFLYMSLRSFYHQSLDKESK